MTTESTSLSRRRGDVLKVAVFLAGLALSLLLAWRAQVGGDQLNLLARGWLLVAQGEWVPYGNPTSTGGAVPGGLTSLLVGGPLAVWRDHRAPILGILLTQIAAFLLLDRLLRDTVGRRERLLFAVVYWLNPWRLVLSGFLWNPGYALLIGALHAWSAWRLRAQPRFMASLVHVLALGLGMQLNLSVTLLLMVSGLLFVSGHLRLRWSGVVAGAVIAAVPLLPWLLLPDEALRLPVGKGFLGRGLILVYPLGRGVLYWLRHASLDLPIKEIRFDFSSLLGDRAASLAADTGDFLTNVVGHASVMLPMLASVWLVCRWRRQGWRRVLPSGQGGRGWLLGYVRISLLAALLVYSLSPKTVMWWDGVSLFHAATLTLVLWAAEQSRLRHRRTLAVVSTWAAVSAAIALLIAFGGPRHRCGGVGSIVIPLRHDHAMLHDLGIHDSCRVPIQPDGWWPDVLPERGP